MTERREEAGTPVRLSGQLVCKNLDEASIVVRHLPTHLVLTRRNRDA
ncbi:MAG: hypothetical protein R2722_07645 [Tessaracoccus sp.]